MRLLIKYYKFEILEAFIFLFISTNFLIWLQIFKQILNFYLF